MLRFIIYYFMIYYVICCIIAICCIGILACKQKIKIKNWSLFAAGVLIPIINLFMALICFVSLFKPFGFELNLNDLRND